MKLLGLTALVMMLGCTMTSEPVTQESGDEQSVPMQPKAPAPDRETEVTRIAGNAAAQNAGNELELLQLPDETEQVEIEFEPVAVPPEREGKTNAVYEPGSRWSCSLEVGDTLVRYAAIYDVGHSLARCALADDGGESERAYELEGNRPDMPCYVGEWGTAVRDGRAYAVSPEGEPHWMNCQVLEWVAPTEDPPAPPPREREPGMTWACSGRVPPGPIEYSAEYEPGDSAVRCSLGELAESYEHITRDEMPCEIGDWVVVAESTRQRVYASRLDGSEAYWLTCEVDAP